MMTIMKMKTNLTVIEETTGSRAVAMKAILSNNNYKYSEILTLVT